MFGVLAVPTISGLATWRWNHGDRRVLLHDPALEAGRRFAAAGEAKGIAPQPIEGDRIRLARSVLAGAPAVIVGVSRHADLLLIADAAREAGYVTAARLQSHVGRCTGAECMPGWNALARAGRAAGADWAEVLAAFAADPRGAAPSASTGNWFGGKDGGLVLGWVLAKRIAQLSPKR